MNIAIILKPSPAFSYFAPLSRSLELIYTLNSMLVANVLIVLDIVRHLTGCLQS